MNQALPGVLTTPLAKKTIPVGYSSVGEVNGRPGSAISLLRTERVYGISAIRTLHSYQQFVQPAEYRYAGSGLSSQSEIGGAIEPV